MSQPEFPSSLVLCSPKMATGIGIAEESKWTESAEFNQVLGAGSYGVVLKAIDKSKGAPVNSAVKIIFPEYSTNPNLMAKEKEKILREVNTVIVKRYPNIVTTTNYAVKQLGSEDIEKIFERMSFGGEARTMADIHTIAARRLGGIETIWIQMELCGHNLRSWINTNNHVEVDVELHIVQLQVGIVQGFVDGLKYLHYNKIIHRDLKPENIFFSHDYSLPVKIGDFGLSREVSDNTCLTSKVGTSDYRAPEADSKIYSFQADLYSLGLVIWEVVQLINSTERRRFFDRLVNDKEESLVRDHPRIAKCRETIIKLTRRNLKERTQNIQEINLIILNFKVTNSEELRHYLKLAIDGDIIELDEVEFVGPFDMSQQKITLRGQGKGTLIKNKSINSINKVYAIKITGNNCEVQNAKVICDKFTHGIELVASHTRIIDTQFEGGSCCLHLEGDGNTLSNLFIFNSKNGIRIEGGGNKMGQIKLNEVTDIGIDIYGDKNEVEQVYCENLQWGVSVNGHNNKLKNVDCRNTRRVSGSKGVYIRSGSGNLVNSLKCSGFYYDLQLDSYTTKSIIRNSVCNGIDLDGHDHSLVNVDGGRLIYIWGSTHRLINCRAEKCINEGTDISLYIEAIELE